MAGRTPDRLRELKEENDRRRRKFEEMERAKREAEETKAKEALERRKQERIAEDERMRKPWQQPEPPKKPILRAGQKKPKMNSPSPAPDASPSADQRRNEAQKARKEWRDGLRAHIEHARAERGGALSPSPGRRDRPGWGQGQGQGGLAVAVAGAPPPEAGGEALTWAELKLAAEAGFEELLRQQQEEQQWVGEGVRGGTRANRSPFRTPTKAPAGPEPVQVTLLPSNNGPSASVVPGNGIPGGPAKSRGSGSGAAHPFPGHTAVVFDAPVMAGSQAHGDRNSQQRQAWGQGNGDGRDARPHGRPQSDQLQPQSQALGVPSSSASVSASGTTAASASQVHTSESLRRGVTTAARYRPTPRQTVEEGAGGGGGGQQEEDGSRAVQELPDDPAAQAAHGKAHHQEDANTLEVQRTPQAQGQRAHWQPQQQWAGAQGAAVTPGGIGATTHTSAAGPDSSMVLQGSPALEASQGAAAGPSLIAAAVRHAIQESIAVGSSTDLVRMSSPTSSIQAGSVAQAQQTAAVAGPAPFQAPLTPPSVSSKPAAAASPAHQEHGAATVTARASQGSSSASIPSTNAEQHRAIVRNIFASTSSTISASAAQALGSRQSVEPTSTSHQAHAPAFMPPAPLAVADDITAHTLGQPSSSAHSSPTTRLRGEVLVTPASPSSPAAQRHMARTHQQPDSLPAHHQAVQLHASLTPSVTHASSTSFDFGLAGGAQVTDDQAVTPGLSFAEASTSELTIPASTSTQPSQPGAQGPIDGTGAPGGLSFAMDCPAQPIEVPCVDGGVLYPPGYGDQGPSGAGAGQKVPSGTQPAAQVQQQVQAGGLQPPPVVRSLSGTPSRAGRKRMTGDGLGSSSSSSRPASADLVMGSTSSQSMLSGPSQLQTSAEVAGSAALKPSHHPESHQQSSSAVPLHSSVARDSALASPTRHTPVASTAWQEDSVPAGAAEHASKADTPQPGSGVAAGPAQSQLPPDLDAILEDIKHLSALRWALKEEFEALGHGQAVAGLASLTSGGPLHPPANEQPHNMGFVPEPVLHNGHRHNGQQQQQQQAGGVAQEAFPPQEQQEMHGQASQATGLMGLSAVQPPQLPVQVEPAVAPSRPPLLSWGLPSAAPKPAPPALVAAAQASEQAAQQTQHQQQSPAALVSRSGPLAGMAGANSGSLVSDSLSTAVDDSAAAFGVHYIHSAEAQPVLRAHTNPLFGQLDMGSSLDRSMQVALVRAALPQRVMNTEETAQVATPPTGGPAPLAAAPASERVPAAAAAAMHASALPHPSPARPAARRSHDKSSAQEASTAAAPATLQLPAAQAAEVPVPQPPAAQSSATLTSIGMPSASASDPGLPHVQPQPVVQQQQVLMHGNVPTAQTSSMVAQVQNHAPALPTYSGTTAPAPLKQAAPVEPSAHTAQQVQLPPPQSAALHTPIVLAATEQPVVVSSTSAAQAQQPVVSPQEPASRPLQYPPPLSAPSAAQLPGPEAVAGPTHFSAPVQQAPPASLPAPIQWVIPAGPPGAVPRPVPQRQGSPSPGKPARHAAAPQPVKPSLPAQLPSPAAATAQPLQWQAAAQQQQVTPVKPQPAGTGVALPNAQLQASQHTQQVPHQQAPQQQDTGGSYVAKLTKPSPARPAAMRTLEKPGLPQSQPATAPLERAPVLEGSYAQAAVEARMRAEKERQEREAIQAALAAQHAAAEAARKAPPPPLPPAVPAPPIAHAVPGAQTRGPTVMPAGASTQQPVVGWGGVPMPQAAPAPAPALQHLPSSMMSPPPPSIPNTTMPSAQAAMQHSRARAAATLADPQQQAGPIKAPANIGSYSNPKPPTHVLMAERAAKAAAAAAAAAVNQATRAGATPASAPVSAVATPAVGLARGVPLSAPATPGLSNTTSSAGPATPSRIPSAPGVNLNRPSQLQQAWASPAGKGAGAATQAQGQGQYNQQQYQAELDALLRDSIEGGKGGDDGALGDDQALYEYLERASDEEDGGKPPGRRAAAEQHLQQTRAVDNGMAGLPPLMGSKKLQDLRPQQLQLPSSGRSTPGGAAASRALTNGSSALSTAAPSGAPQQRTSGNGASSSQSGSKPPTPFTAAIRELMGLPGAAPLQQATSGPGAEPGRASASRQAAAGHGAGTKAPTAASNKAGASSNGLHTGVLVKLSDEEQQLLASLQRLDSTILAKGLAQAGLVAGTGNLPTPSASGVPAAAARSPARPRAGKAGTPSKAGGASAGIGSRHATPPRGGAASRGVGAGGEVGASLQALQLRDSIERLDVQLEALRARMADRAQVVGLAVPPGMASPRTAAHQQRPAQYGQPGAGGGPSSNGYNSSPGRSGSAGRRAPVPAAKARTPTPNKAKAIRDARQMEMLAAAGQLPPAAAAAAARPPSGVTHTGALTGVAPRSAGAVMQSAAPAPVAVTHQHLPGRAQAAGNIPPPGSWAPLSAPGTAAAGAPGMSFAGGMGLPPMAPRQASAPTHAGGVPPPHAGYPGTTAPPAVLPGVPAPQLAWGPTGATLPHYAGAEGTVASAQLQATGMAPHPHQQQSQQQAPVAFVPMVLPDGQVAYIPRMLGAEQPGLQGHQAPVHLHQPQQDNSVPVQAWTMASIGNSVPHHPQLPTAQTPQWEQQQQQQQGLSSFAGFPVTPAGPANGQATQQQPSYQQQQAVAAGGAATGWLSGQPVSGSTYPSITTQSPHDAQALLMRGQGPSQPSLYSFTPSTQQQQQQQQQAHPFQQAAQPQIPPGGLHGSEPQQQQQGGWMAPSPMMQQQQQAHMTAVQSIAAHAPTHGSIMRSRTPPTRSSSGGSMRGGDAFNSAALQAIPVSYPGQLPVQNSQSPAVRVTAVEPGYGAAVPGSHMQQLAASQGNPGSPPVAGGMYTRPSAASQMPAGPPPGPAVPSSLQAPAQARPAVQPAYNGAAAAGGGLIKAFNLDVLLS